MILSWTSFKSFDSIYSVNTYSFNVFEINSVMTTFHKIYFTIRKKPYHYTSHVLHVRWNIRNCFSDGPIDSAVFRFGSVSVHTFNTHLDLFNDVGTIIIHSYLEQSMQGDFFIRHSFHWFLFQEVDQASQHGLMRNDQ